MTAPQYALVGLQDKITFDQASRFGYLGTAYSAMRKAGVAPGKNLLVNGISGTLGIGGALFGIAMGATRILGTARNKALLQRVKALAPARIEVMSLEDGEPVDAWAHRVTNGEGIDIFIDALGPGAPHETFLQGMRSLRRGGKSVDIGAVAGNLPIDIHTMMDCQHSLSGSLWFSAGEGQDMADMAAAGTLDLKSSSRCATRSPGWTKRSRASRTATVASATTSSILIALGAPSPHPRRRNKPS